MPAPTKSISGTRPRYDLETVKEAASRGLWPSIHLNTCGITSDFLKSQHGPCPKHGGKDKWRIFPDYEDTGGCVCTDCGKMADGIEVVRRFNGGCSFPDAINMIGDYLGLTCKPDTKTERTQEAKDPAKHLKLLGQNEQMATIWCGEFKQGITPEALWAFGAEYAMYRRQYPVFALPIRGQQNETVGYVLYHALGKTLPIFAKGSPEPAEMAKVKVTSGSKAGWIGPIPKPTDKLIWKTEGPSCALATYSLGLPEGHSVCCNAFGAEENPATSSWMLERFKGIEEAFVVHDSDKSGQRGATEVINENGTSRPGWAPAIANFTKQVRNYVLPGEMTDSHGKDLRDMINQRRSEGYTNGETYQYILSSAQRADVVAPIPFKGMSAIAGDDNEERPKKITNGTAEVEWENGKKSTIYRAKPILDIAQSIFDHSGNWPKRAGNDLFVMQGDRAKTISNSSGLFAWLRESIEVNWMKAANLATKDEIYITIENHCERYSNADSSPHFPPIEGVLYLCKERQSGTGDHLTRFINFFKPSSEIDRQLLLAATVTTFWGGPPGARPGFQFSVKSGTAQGAGKSTAAEMIASLSGGTVNFGQDDSLKTITERLLSGEKPGRVVFIDNIKTHVFSSASIESLITSRVISGKEMYFGNGSRPNYFTFFVTFNAANFSRDMAQRLVSVVMDKSTKTAEWRTDIDRFINDHKLDIIDDIKKFFERPKTKLSQYNRWATWQDEIVSRLDDPESIIEELAQRESENDSDAKIASDILDYTANYLSGFGYFPPYRVHIGCDRIAAIVKDAVGSPYTSREAGLLIDRLIGCGLIRTISRNPSRASGRGFICCSADNGQGIVDYNLEAKIDDREKKDDNDRELRRAKARKGEFSNSGGIF